MVRMTDEWVKAARGLPLTLSEMPHGRDEMRVYVGVELPNGKTYGLTYPTYPGVSPHAEQAAQRALTRLLNTEYPLP